MTKHASTCFPYFDTAQRQKPLSTPQSISSGLSLLMFTRSWHTQYSAVFAQILLEYSGAVLNKSTQYPQSNPGNSPTSNAVSVFYIMNAPSSPHGKIPAHHRNSSKTAILMIHLHLHLHLHQYQNPSYNLPPHNLRLKQYSHLLLPCRILPLRVQHSIPLPPVLHIPCGIGLLLRPISTRRADE